MQGTFRHSDEIVRDYRERRFWLDEPIAHYLDRAVALFPERTAVIEDGTRLTFADVNQQASDIAAALYATGIRGGDVVSFQLPNRAEAILLHQALMKLGAISNPIIPTYRGRELRFILRQAKSKLVVIPSTYRGTDFVELYRGFAADLPELGRIVVLGDVDPDDRFTGWHDFVSSAPDDARTAVAALPGPDAGDIALLLYTSGTTADPKGVLHTHNSLVYDVGAQIKFFSLNERDVIFNPSPVTHATGVIFALTMPFLLGAPVVLQDLWDPARALELIATEHASFMVFATPFLQGLLDAVDQERTALPSIRYIVCGGADIPEVLARGATERLGTVVRMYGSSEAPSITCSTKWDPVDVRISTDGLPMWPTEIAISDGADGVAPTGTIGEVLWRGPDGFAGYLDAELNAASFTRDGFFRSGDLGRLDEHGALHIEGRIKDIINRSGEKFSTYEIENLLSDHEAVGEIAIVAGPDTVTGERACLFVVPRATGDLTLETVAAHLLEREVARQKIPESLYLVSALPKTASGKIQKFALRKWLTDPDSAAADVQGMSVLAAYERTR